MSAVDPQDYVSATVTDRDVAGSNDTSSRSQTPQGEHEAVNHVGTLPSTEGTAGDRDGAFDTSTNTPPIEVDGQEEANAAALSASVEVTKNKIAKPSVAVKPPSGKSSGGPPTPLVKKVINSGTFGAGSVKPTNSKPGSGPVLTSTKPVTVAPGLKKSTSSSSAPSKPTMASARNPAAPATAPNRRLSVVPPKSSAPPISKPTLSSSASARPASSANATRASVVSPAGSATSSASRPRASVSEGVKRAPLSSRQSVSGTVKPPPARSSGPPLVRPARTTTSISSIREVKEDGKALEDLQVKLKDATESLALKAETVVELESQVGDLKSSLENAMSDAASKGLQTEELNQEKSLLERQLEETKAALGRLEAEQQPDSVLEALHQDLEAARAATATQEELVQRLQAQIKVLEAEALSAQESLEKLQASASSDISTATAAIEREALLQAQASLKATSEETEALKAEHAEALQAAETQLEGLRVTAALVNSLTAQVAVLKAEKEENASKLSELEIEILELKESQEVAEDERERSLARIRTLEDELSKGVASMQQAAETLATKEKDHLAQLEAINKSHTEAIEAAIKEHADTSNALELVKSELSSSLAVLDQAKADALDAVEQHNGNLEQAKQSYEAKHTELSEEIKRITADLQNQESYFDSKVDAVKNEHKQLLQEAYERAKNEAREEHTQELQMLRAESKATIEQIQAMNQSALTDLKVDHESILDSEKKGSDKQIGTLKIDLKATQDDLVKAKAALEAARSEVESLTAQRDEARATINSIRDNSPEQGEETTLLKTELSRYKDDLTATNEVLDLTRASLTEMSNNRTRDLEEAAQARASEVIKLRAAHDEEVTSLVSQKSSLQVKLSDLEGELATLKATITSDTPAPKNNGNGAVHPPSPGVTKEELQRLHEAHNLKIHDIQADHEKAMRALRDELEKSENTVMGLQQEVGRKAMEIEYLEQDQEESQEQITRLKEDVDSLTERLSKEEKTSA